MGFKNQYNDKKVSIPKTNNDKLLSKKELLKKQFIEKTTVNNKQSNLLPTENKSTNLPKNITNDEILKLKVKIKTLENKVKILKDEEKNIKIKTNSYKDKMDKYYNLYIKSKEELGNKVSKINNELNRVQEEYNNFINESSTYTDKIEELKKEVEFYKKDNDRLTNDKKSLLGTIKSKTSESIKLEEENQKLEKDLKDTNKSVKYLNTSIKSLELDKTLLLNRIESLENIKNTYKEALDKINDKNENNISNKTFCSKIADIYKNFKGLIHYKYSLLIKKNKKNEPSKKMYGELKSTIFGYKIVCYENMKEYKIAKFNDKRSVIKDINGRTCMFRLDKSSNKAIVISVYKNIDAMNRHLESFKRNEIKSANKKIKKQKVETLKYDTPYKVLIISALAPSSYINKLKLLGLDTFVFNSYYEGAKRLDSILQKYDIVVYCVDSSRHYVKDIIKKQSDYTSNRDKYIIAPKGGVAYVLEEIDKFIQNKNQLEVDQELTGINTQ